jgi:hypothetical protein
VSSCCSSMNMRHLSAIYRNQTKKLNFEGVKIAGIRLNKATLLILLLLLANAIGFFAARQYFDRNTCIACTEESESGLEKESTFTDGKTLIYDWTFTLIRFLGSGAQAR